MANASNLEFKEPNNLREVLKSEKWCREMNEEYKAISDNQTWNLEPFDPSINVVGCKWCIRLKERLMVRLRDIRPIW